MAHRAPSDPVDGQADPAGALPSAIPVRRRRSREAAEAWQRRVAENQRQQPAPVAEPEWPASAAKRPRRRRSTPVPQELTLSTRKRSGLPRDSGPCRSRCGAGDAEQRPEGWPDRDGAIGPAAGWATVSCSASPTGLGLADYLGAAIVPTVTPPPRDSWWAWPWSSPPGFRPDRGPLPLGVVHALGVLGISASGLPGLASSVVPATHVVYVTPADLPAAGDRAGRGHVDRRPEPAADRTDTVYKARVELGRPNVARCRRMPR